MYISFPNYDRVSIHQTQYNALTAQLLLLEYPWKVVGDDLWIAYL